MAIQARPLRNTRKDSKDFKRQKIVFDSFKKQGIRTLAIHASVTNFNGESSNNAPDMEITIKRPTLLALLFTAYGVFFQVPAAATLQELQVGMEVPEFSLKTVTGEPKKFSELRGEKLTLLIFWSTWSMGSEKNLARMQKIYQQFKGQGLSIIGINEDEQHISDQTIARIRGVSEKLKLTFPVLVDHGLAVFHSYGVIALPTTLVLDNRRVIQYELSGYPLVGSEELVAYVTTMLEGKKTVTVVPKKRYQPNNTALRFFNMGKNTLKSKRMADTAEIWFRKAIEADPNFVLPYLSLGKFYLQKGNIAAAKAQFEVSLTKEPDNVVALCEIGMLLANEGKVEEGISCLTNALKTNDAYTPYYYYSGLLSGRKGNLKNALKMFDTATRINPMDYNIYVYKARMYEELKMLPEASEAYRKALEMALTMN